MLQKFNQYIQGRWKKEFDLSLDSESTLITVFSGAKSLDQIVLKELKNKFPKSTLIGCTTAGEIYDNKVFDQSISISIVKFEKSHFKVFKQKIESTDDSFKIGQQMVHQLINSDLKGIFCLTDGLLLNGSEFSRGVGDLIESQKINFSFSGGMSADGADFKKTFQIYQDEIFSEVVIAVGFYGKNLDFITSAAGGWEAIEVDRKITKSEKNILYEIDGQPALQLYKKLLGPLAQELPSSALYFPISIRKNNNLELVRTILAVDEEKNALIFAGDVPQDSVFVFMKANHRGLINGAELALNKVAAQLKESECLAIATSCVGRKLVLGALVDDEVDIIQSKLNQKLNLIGFYSYGEFSSQQFFKCELYNQTMALTFIREN